MTTDRTTVWRAPDGTHWRAYGPATDTATTTELYEVTQDPGTRQWNRVSPGQHHALPTQDFEATYIPVPAEPLLDPRITRLTELVTALLADHEHVAGREHHSADAIRTVLADVAGIPEEAREERRRAEARGQRVGFHRGAG